MCLTYCLNRVAFILNTAGSSYPFFCLSLRKYLIRFNGNLVLCVLFFFKTTKVSPKNISNCVHMIWIAIMYVYVHMYLNCNAWGTVYTIGRSSHAIRKCRALEQYSITVAERTYIRSVHHIYLYILFAYNVERFILAGNVFACIARKHTYCNMCIHSHYRHVGNTHTHYTHTLYDWSA